MSAYYDLKVSQIDTASVPTKSGQNGVYHHPERWPSDDDLELCRREGSPAFNVSVSDNGENGDGAWIEFHNAHGRDAEVFGAQFTLSDLRVLHRAIGAVIEMREASEL